RSKATVKVRIAIKIRDARLVPDMGVRVGFLGREPAASAARPAGVLVPIEAVRGEGRQGVVFVHEGPRARRRDVTLGAEVGGERQVLEGLKEGERVVLSPPPSLPDNGVVRVDAGEARR